MAGNDDATTPPPGGYLREPRPDSTDEAQQEARQRAEQLALERIAVALEALQRDVAEVSRLLAERLPRREG